MNVHSVNYGSYMTTSSDKRDRIVQTSLDLIAERGFHGAPMALIAEKAGVGAGTIYRYFESKDVLIIALFQEIKGKIEAFLTKDYDEDKPLREKYIYLCNKTYRIFYNISPPFPFYGAVLSFSIRYVVAPRQIPG